MPTAAPRNASAPRRSRWRRSWTGWRTRMSWPSCSGRRSPRAAGSDHTRGTGMNAGIFLADAGNIGLIACAAIDTAAAVSYAIRARGGGHGAWWRTPVGLHLMCFMLAFAVVLDESAVYLVTSGQVLARVAPLRPDWFAWLRVASCWTLISVVLACLLWLLLRSTGQG